MAQEAQTNLALASILQSHYLLGYDVIAHVDTRIVGITMLQLVQPLQSYRVASSVSSSAYISTLVLHWDVQVNWLRPSAVLITLTTL